MVMLLALAWLTVSLPFVYADQQARQQVQQQTNDAAEDNSNPLSNTTEEKTENGANSLSEYLHLNPHIEHAAFRINTQYSIHSSDTYIAFHPEFTCPPPDGHVS
jgi:hypothetical protein